MLGLGGLLFPAPGSPRARSDTDPWPRGPRPGADLPSRQLVAAALWPTDLDGSWGASSLSRGSSRVHSLPLSPAEPQSPGLDPCTGPQLRRPVMGEALRSRLFICSDRERPRAGARDSARADWTRVLVTCLPAPQGGGLCRPESCPHPPLPQGLPTGKGPLPVPSPHQPLSCGSPPSALHPAGLWAPLLRPAWDTWGGGAVDTPCAQRESRRIPRDRAGLPANPLVVRLSVTWPCGLRH